MSRKLKLLSLNVRGLRNVNKRRAIFSYLKAKKATNFCLQERYSSIEDEKVWPAEWGGGGGGQNFFFAWLFALQRCLHSFESTFHISLATRRSGLRRKVLIVKVIIDEECFFVTNIYAPTDYLDQDCVIRLLSEQLISNTDTSKVVISGDWNTTLNPIDKRGGQPWKATNYRNSLISLIEELNLIDIYIDKSIPPKNILLMSQNL